MTEDCSSVLCTVQRRADALSYLEGTWCVLPLQHLVEREVHTDTDACTCRQACIQTCRKAKAGRDRRTQTCTQNMQSDRHMHTEHAVQDTDTCKQRQTHAHRDRPACIQTHAGRETGKQRDMEAERVKTGIHMQAETKACTDRERHRHADTHTHTHTHTDMHMQAERVKTGMQTDRDRHAQTDKHLTLYGLQ